MSAVRSNPFQQPRSAERADWATALPSIPGPQRKAFPFGERHPKAALRVVQEEDSSVVDEVSAPEPEVGEAERDYARAIAGLADASSSMRAALSADAVSLGITIAESIVRRTVELDPTLVQAAVERVLDDLEEKSAGDAKVRLSPGDLERLESLEPTAFPPEGVEVLADPALGTGDCVVDVGGYLFDGTLAPKLDAIRAQIGELGGEAANG